MPIIQRQFRILGTNDTTPVAVLLAARGPKEKEIRDAWVIEDRQRRLMYDSSERLERKKTRPELLLLDLGNLVKRGLKLWN